jgi:hypothetical protein
MELGTQTILCFDCKELMDVPKSIRAGAKWANPPLTGRIREGFAEIKIQCERDPSHRWRSWTVPDVCPKCGSAMIQAPDGEYILWD